MHLNRRKMFGVAAGGAIAGPSLARAAVQQVQIAPPSYPAPDYGYGAEAKTSLSQDPNWRLDTLTKLKRLASGDIRDEDRKYPTEGGPQPFHTLKSVSDDARHFMRGRLYERQWQERTIKHALDCLNEYDKTGILRTFF